LIQIFAFFLIQINRTGEHEARGQRQHEVEQAGEPEAQGEQESAGDEGDAIGQADGGRAAKIPPAGREPLPRLVDAHGLHGQNERSRDFGSISHRHMAPIESAIGHRFEWQRQCEAFVATA
jgi:hypothetical protein